MTAIAKEAMEMRQIEQHNQAMKIAEMVGKLFGG